MNGIKKEILREYIREEIKKVISEEMAQQVPTYTATRLEDLNLSDGLKEYMMEMDVDNNEHYIKAESIGDFIDLLSKYEGDTYDTYGVDRYSLMKEVKKLSQLLLNNNIDIIIR